MQRPNAPLLLPENILQIVSTDGVSLSGVLADNGAETKSTMAMQIEVKSVVIVVEWSIFLVNRGHYSL
ncbi:MAG: hypothetical protein ACI9J2_002117 [Saprospiraceae bacterium]